jgi:AraC-like DNA-binding protein
MSFKKSALFNIYLLVLFFFISVRLIHNGLLGIYDTPIINEYYVYIGPIYLFAIPTFYLYFDSLYADRIYFNPRHLLHLIFPLVNLFLNIFKHHFSEVNIALIETVQVFSILGFLFSYGSISLYLGYKKLRHKSSVFLELSTEHEEKMRKWTIFLFVIMCILSFRLVYSVFSEIKEETRIMGYHGSLVISIIWLVVFVKVLRSPELLYGYPKLKNITAQIDQIPTETSSLWSRGDVDIINVKDVKLSESISAKIEPYFIKIEDYVTSNRFFSNPKHSIKDLANGLNIPVSHLAYIFKYHCEMPFVEYRNHQRIKDAVNFVHSNFLKTQTLESLAIAVGFTSYNSFFVSFKKHTGSSPKLFLESLSS